MPKWIILFALTAPFLWTFPSAAEDSRPRNDEIPVAAPDSPDWTGPYLGVGLGGRWVNSQWVTDCLATVGLPAGCPNDIFSGSTRIGNDNPANFDDRAMRLAAYFGVDHQVARWVIGVEGDFGWADNGVSRAGIPGTWSLDYGGDLDTAEVESEWDASMRARVGFLLAPTVLAYATGGLAMLHLEIGASCEGVYPAGWCVAPHNETVDASSAGWTVGGGAEWMFATGWALRGEYRYSDFGSRSFTFFQDTPIDSVAVTVESKASVAFFGISRRF